MNKNETPIPFYIENSLLRNKMMFGFGMSDFECGAANGYVAIPPSNSLYGKSVEEIENLTWLNRIYGGITFAGSSDCVNFKNINYIFYNNLEKLPSGWWVIGFDTIACNNPKEMTLSKCIMETIKLYRYVDKYSKFLTIIN